MPPSLKFDDFTWTDDGDFVFDTDPLDDGTDVGWDLMSTTKWSREQRRTKIDEEGSHPTSNVGSLKQHYLELLRRIYPNTSEVELLDSMREWNYLEQDEYEAARQLMRERAKTANPDWTIFSECGADMETLIGEDMTQITAEQGSMLIERALTYDQLIETDEINITYYDHGNNTLLYLVDVLISAQFHLRLVVPFSFTDGPYLIRKQEALNALPIAI